MIKVAIVEDEKEIADVMCGFLDRYAKEKDEKIVYFHFACTTDFLSQYDGFDIVFMDINFKNDMDGIRAARKLREKDSAVTLIFVTSFEQFAVKGYEVEAFDFIVKPVVYSDFALRFSRAVKRVRKGKLDSINIRVGGNVKIMPVKDIKYVEVMKHRLIFHTTEGVLECAGSLREAENCLTEKYFARCNNCYLVNLWYVSGVEGNTVNVDGEELSISRPRRKEFMSALTRYLGK